MGGPPLCKEPKLTKKQKKALAFRDRGKGKGKGQFVDSQGADVFHDVPIMEDQDEALADLPNDKTKAATLHTNQKSLGTTVSAQDGPSRRASEKQRESDEVDAATGTETLKKRKREATTNADDAAEVPVGQRSTKKAKRSRTNDDSGIVDADKAGEVQKQRLILFVGNLKYTTSLESIQRHFAACHPPPTIRLLTPKPSANSEKSARNKSKGCAFLEFSQKTGLQQALKLHQSELDGRQINVELTAGGGGKSEERLTKLRERNKELGEQRRKRLEKEGSGQSSVPQRYSATSGIRKAPLKQRTWSVGDTIDDGQTHRGGKKHTRQRKSMPRHQGTGVNAIPVG